MSRKNKKAKYKRISEQYIKDEQQRTERQEKKKQNRRENEARRLNANKKEKVKPVIAHPERLEKGARKMAKMMKKMNLDQSGIKAKLKK